MIFISFKILIKILSFCFVKEAYFELINRKFSKNSEYTSGMFFLTKIIFILL